MTRRDTSGEAMAQAISDHHNRDQAVVASQGSVLMIQMPTTAWRELTDTIAGLNTALANFEERCPRAPKYLITESQSARRRATALVTRLRQPPKAGRR